MRVPIFDGGRRDARRAEAASQYRQEKVQTSDLKEQIELDVRLALDALQSAEEQVKVAREGLELAENELAQARRRFDAGVADGLEVTDAQTRLERARDNQIAALYQLQPGADRSGAGDGRRCGDVDDADEEANPDPDRADSRWRRAPRSMRSADRAKPPDNRIVVSGNIELTEVNIAFKTAGPPDRAHRGRRRRR